MSHRLDRPRRGRLGLGIGLLYGLGILCGSVLALGPEAIAWRTDFRRAEQEARALDRLLWVQFTGSWCPNCLRLERESLVHPRIVARARDFFVPVKIQSEQNEDLVERFGLRGIPATVVLRPSGEVVAHHEGYVDAAAFSAFLDDVLIRGGRAPRPTASHSTTRPLRESALSTKSIKEHQRVSMADDPRRPEPWAQTGQLVAGAAAGSVAGARPRTGAAGAVTLEARRPSSASERR
jgi:hypothetical protein